jgi:hypothetical protein
VEQAEEEAKKMVVIYLDVTVDEESVKKMLKEVICLVDSSNDKNDKNDKKNYPNSKRYKKE